MNEEAVKDAYQLFVSNGYNKSIEEFTILMNTNENARKDMYELFVSNGYNKTPEEFNVLIGVQEAPSVVETKVDVQEEVPLKKKEDTVSPSGLSSLGLPSVTDVIQEKAELGEQQIAEQESRRKVEQQEAADFFDVSKPFAPKPKQMQQQMQMQMMQPQMQTQMQMQVLVRPLCLFYLVCFPFPNPACVLRKGTPKYTILNL